MLGHQAPSDGSVFWLLVRPAQRDWVRLALFFLFTFVFARVPTNLCQNFTGPIDTFLVRNSRNGVVPAIQKPAYRNDSQNFNDLSISEMFAEFLEIFRLHRVRRDTGGEGQI